MIKELNWKGIFCFYFCFLVVFVFSGDFWFKSSLLLEDINSSNINGIPEVTKIITIDRNFFISDIKVEFVDGSIGIVKYDANFSMRSNRFYMIS